MLTVHKQTYLPAEQRWLLEGVCLAADKKPVENVANGSVLIEMDTAALCFFDAEQERWLPFTPPEA